MTACIKCGHDPSSHVTATWQFEVPLEIQSGNDHVVNAPRHGKARWGASGAYRKRRVAWETAVRIAAREWLASATLARLLTKRRVTITRVYGARQRDFDRDNLYAGAKVAVDALKRCGVILDDSRKWCELHVTQERGTTRCTRFLIEELG